MINIEQFLRPKFRLPTSLPALEMDPLREDHTLQEAQLLDVRFDVMRSTVGLLFELRGALQLREANTGLLVARGVRESAWTTGVKSRRRTAWTVGGSLIGNVGGLLSLQLGIFPGPDTQFKLVAESAAFYLGDVPGLDKVPNYVEDDEATVRAQLAGWHSELVPLHATFFNWGPTPTQSGW